MPNPAAAIRGGGGSQVIPGLTGPDFKEAVSSGRVLILEVQPKVRVSVSFVNDGMMETSVMIHRKANPILGTWENVARKGNGGGKDYADWHFEPSNAAEVLVISGWHKNLSDNPSGQPWHQSAYRLNEEKKLDLAKDGVQYGPGFEDGGGGNDFNEPQLTITCKYV